MVDKITTQKRTNQYGGNYSSDEYNLRVEENYQDLVYLYNKYNLIDKTVNDKFGRLLKDHIFLTQAVRDAEDRLKALEASEQMISLYSVSQIENARFAGVSQYAIASAEQLSFNSIYNFITLPYVSASSLSTLKSYSSDGRQVIPNFINMNVVSASNIDAPGAVLDTSPPYFSLYDSYDKVWSRSIVSETSDPQGASMYFYVSIPQNIPNQKINNIRFTPYPINSVDILSVEYTKNPTATLSASDGYRPLNELGLYQDDTNAVGYIAPGGWTRAVNSDAVLGAGPLYFNINIQQTDNKPITAIRILMRQRNYFKENNKYIYTYGLSDLDIRVDKYLPQGKAIIKFTAPENTLINSVSSVTPKIYNVPLSLIDLAYDYRVIYPTSAGGYSESPQGGSSHVWVEVTLSQLDDGTVPVLSDLILKYT